MFNTIRNGGTNTKHQYGESLYAMSSETMRTPDEIEIEEMSGIMQPLYIGNHGMNANRSNGDLVRCKLQVFQYENFCSND